MDNIETVNINNYILVFDLANGRKIYQSKKLPKSFKIVQLATQIFSPGTYPIPAKDRYGLFSFKHPELDEKEFLSKLI
jgi:Ribonuclease G/E